MAATRYDVADLETALTSIYQKFDQAPREVVGATHVNNLKTELKDTLKFLIKAPVGTKDKKTLSGEPPIVKGFREWADTLVWEDLGPRKPNPRFVCTTLWYCRTLEHRARWTKSPDGFLLYLSLLPAEQPKAFEWDSASFPLAQWQPDDASQKRTPVEQASYYLDLLNAEFNDREPEEYYKECLWTELRDVAVPDYKDAAQQWYTYANQHWPALRPQIFTLFNSSNKSNFVQWALKWVREGESGLFRNTSRALHSNTAEATINLTNDLCTGVLSPLHIAAMLGIPSLCKDLISAGVDPTRVWKGRLPLHDALDCEPACFLVYRGYSRNVPFQTDFNRYNPQHRTETILALLDAFPSRLDESKRGVAELAPMALWAAYKLRSPEILEKTLEKGADVTRSFLKDLIDEEELSPDRPGDKELLSRLLTYLHGHCLVNRVDSEALGMESSPLIKDAMDYHAVDWYLVDGSCPLPQASPTRLVLLAQQCILAGSSENLARICLEPRFNPNPIPGEFSHGAETLLHLAVETDDPAMVDALMKAGADLTAVDECNRTPLMNCESPMMTEKLVRGYGAQTECQDNEGRTIWHAAAFNNDLAALSTLSRCDPWKSSNLERKSDEGSTPLAEAMALVRRIKALKYHGLRSVEPYNPVAARFLLKLAREQGGDGCLASPVPLTHLAAEWGDLDMIEDLVALEADWQVLDEEGRTALHLLNFAAPAEMVHRLKVLCHGADLNRHPYNVLERFFKNSVPSICDDSDWSPSKQRELTRHPSSYGPIDKERFKALCTPEILNREGAVHPWESFCKNVLPFPFSGPVLRRVKRALQYTVECFLEEGIIADYEQREGKSGVLPLLDRANSWDWRKQQHRRDEVRDMYEADVIWNVFRASKEGLRHAFAKSDAAVDALNIAIQENHLYLADRLCDEGTTIYSYTSDEASMRFPLITAIDTEFLKHDDEDSSENQVGKHLNIFRVLSDKVDPEELNKGRIPILKTFWSVIRKYNPSKLRSSEANKLVLLMENLWDLDDLRRGHGDCSFLDEIVSKSEDLRSLLNDNGAGLTGPCEVCTSAGADNEHTEG